jgi:G:T/U-mismatch repair DNA glycosylase
MNQINHQFLDSDFFFPYWKINTLVLGTFNPCCGEETDYFYGRCQNNFWRTIEEIYRLDYRWFQNNFERKLEFMKENKFGCTDIIKSIVLSDGVDRKEICGLGYSDQFLFTSKKCKIEYNIEEIKSHIIKNNISKIINTWGKRCAPKYFKDLIFDLKVFCEKNEIEFITDCPSPSGRLRSIKDKMNLNIFYKLNLLINND